jgi:hypothetical protein
MSKLNIITQIKPVDYPTVLDSQQNPHYSAYTTNPPIAAFNKRCLAAPKSSNSTYAKKTKPRRQEGRAKFQV